MILPVTERLIGYCPMGCGATLFAGEGGHITCSWYLCPRPTAVDDILADREIRHIVDLGDETFTIRHPLRERLDDAMLTCSLHAYLADLDGPPRKPGRYRAYRAYGAGDTWRFEAMDTPRAP